jgi:AraC family transcriptional regulator, transcriptional activator of pobA
MSRAVRRRIPSFSLYGEQSAEARDRDPLHVEDIPSRSSKYLWKIGSHRHTGLCQCVYVTAGPVTAEIEGARIEFHAPTVFIIPSGTVHGFNFRTDTQGFVLSMDLDLLLNMAAPSHQAPILALFAAPRAMNLAADLPLADRAAELFTILMREFKQPESAGPVSGWLACCVLWLLAGGMAHGQTPAHDRQDLDRLSRFRLLIEGHYLKHWPVARYARQLALSESSLNRLCQDLTGGTAFDVVQQRLLLEARRRLMYVPGSVAMIAAELGFKDPAYFCRFFRRHVGVSPTAFRRRQADG